MYRFLYFYMNILCFILILLNGKCNHDLSKHQVYEILVFFIQGFEVFSNRYLALFYPCFYDLSYFRFE